MLKKSILFIVSICLNINSIAQESEFKIINIKDSLFSLKIFNGSDSTILVQVSQFYDFSGTNNVVKKEGGFYSLSYLKPDKLIDSSSPQIKYIEVRSHQSYLSKIIIFEEFKEFEFTYCYTTKRSKKIKKLSKKSRGWYNKFQWSKIIIEKEGN